MYENSPEKQNQQNVCVRVCLDRETDNKELDYVIMEAKKSQDPSTSWDPGEPMVKY